LNKLLSNFTISGISSSLFSIYLRLKDLFTRLDLKMILMVIILAVVLVIMALVFATIFRRASRSKQYKILDRHREFFSKKISEYLESGNDSNIIEELASPPNSVKWHAIQEILLELSATGKHRENLKSIFMGIGYVDYYEKKLSARNNITKASAIDKLGKMQCERSTDKLIPLLKDENPEIVSVTVRSLSKIGSPAGLRGILEEIPNLLSRSLVTVKTIETSVPNFGPASIPLLIEYGEKYHGPMCKALILEMLSASGSSEAIPLALSHLNHQDPEVRSKALKVIGAAGNGLEDSLITQAAALLSDPVWFVRLQAAKALGKLRYEKAIERLGDTLLDKNWQVRNAAAMALTKFGNRSLHIFLGTLLYKDRYAKESICEEIQRTDFIDVLFENMNAKDVCVYKKSKQILEIMKSLSYCTPFLEYLKTGTNEKIKYELEIILSQEQPPHI